MDEFSTVAHFVKLVIPDITACSKNEVLQRGQLKDVGCPLCVFFMGVFLFVFVVVFCFFGCEVISVSIEAFHLVEFVNGVMASDFTFFVFPVDLHSDNCACIAQFV